MLFGVWMIRFLLETGNRRVSTCVFLVICTTVCNSSNANCDAAQGRCVHNDDCLPLLRRYLRYCSDVIDERVTPVCYPRCRRALASLLDHPDGWSFVTCDCHGNQNCLAQRQRLVECRRKFDSLLNHHLLLPGEDDDVILCSEAHKSCFEDDACHDALSISNMVCSRVPKTRRCGRQCRISRRNLYQNIKGRRLLACRCDDSKNDSCNVLRRNIYSTCQRKRGNRSTSSTPLSALTVPLTRLPVRELSPRSFHLGHRTGNGINPDHNDTHALEKVHMVPGSSGDQHVIDNSKLSEASHIWNGAAHLVPSMSIVLSLALNFSALFQAF